MFGFTKRPLFLIARKNLKTYPVRIFLTTSSIILGVAVIIASSIFSESNKNAFDNLFSGIYEGGFFANTKGDFQLPHIDEDGDYHFKVQLMFYFSKGWEKGDPGGTYIAESDDEETIIFEPYDLDNSMVCFEETPHSWHGTRYITKDVIRQAVSTSLM